MKELRDYYFEVTDLWKKLCELHTDLFHLTCDEYALLLSSDLEKLELKVADKEELVIEIKQWEKYRQDLIGRMSKDFPQLDLNSVQSLLKIMNQYEVESDEKFLMRFNGLLIDLIEKIQGQNKRNQLFINKALHVMKQIRLESQGKKVFQSYSKNGNSTSSAV